MKITTEKRKLTWRSFFPHILLVLGMIVANWYSSVLFSLMILSFAVVPILAVAFLITFIADLLDRKISFRWKYFFSLFLVYILMLFLSKEVIGPFAESVYQKHYGEYDLQTGEQLVLAVERFKTDKGTLPKEISDLVPDYLSSAPKTKNGKEFRYFLSKGASETESYSVMYPGFFGSMCYPDENTDEKKWGQCGFPL